MTDYSTSSISSSSSSSSSCSSRCGSSGNINSNKILSGLHKILGCKENESPRFLNSQHMKVTRLSALRTGRLYHS